MEAAWSMIQVSSFLTTTRKTEYRMQTCHPPSIAHHITPEICDISVYTAVCYKLDYGQECLRPENFILFLFLMFGTLALGLMILQFEQSWVFLYWGTQKYFSQPDVTLYCRQFLSATKREMLADYALPIAVIVFSMIGSWAFNEISCKFLTMYVTHNFWLFDAIVHAKLNCMWFGFSSVCLEYS